MSATVPSKATVTYWALDAFDCLRSGSYKKISAEVLSRVNAMIEAYAFYDKIVVSQDVFSERKRLIAAMDPTNQIFEIASGELQHAQTLSLQGVTYENDLYEKSAKELEKDSRAWFIEHDPNLAELDLKDDPNGEMARISGNFYKTQLWQWGSCKEIAETNGATILLPNSLLGIEAFDTSARTNDFVIEKIRQLREEFKQGITDITFYTDDPFKDFLTAIPPVFALYCDFYKPSDSPFEALWRVREDMEDARKMRREFESNIRQAKTFNEKRDIVASSNSDWARLKDAKFTKPKFLRAEVSGGDVAKAALDAFAAKATAGISGISKLIEYGQARSAGKRFKSYTRLFESAGNAVIDPDFLKSLEAKFGVKEFVKFQS